MAGLPDPLNLLLLLIGLFLILLVLIQRGKGGGLIGALGGSGGSSPFGSRAGDQFTRLTIYVACVWLFLTMIQVRAIMSANEEARRNPAGLMSQGEKAATVARAVLDPPPTHEVGVLLSMTGYGEARHAGETLSLSIELRALNNRYLKVSLRAPDPYHLLEAEFEKVIRRSVKRGTLQVQLRCERQAAPHDFRIDPVALGSYVQQLRTLGQQLGLRDQGEILLGQVLQLPGVVPEAGSRSYQLHEDWPIIERVLGEALQQMQGMRREEGRAMAQELLSHRDTIRHHLDVIRAKAPAVVTGFRDRLLDRVRQLLGTLDVKIDQNDLLREVSVFAERSDIAEEVVRLATHLDHFQEIMKEEESPGRKLEFLTQEMFREANTIGSKASDVDISREVVEIKGTLEKIRELIQNVE